MNGSLWLRMVPVLLAVMMPAMAEEVPARLEWARRVELSTPISGVVAEVLVSPGDRVEQGALLLRLDARGLRARIEEAEAAVAREKEHREEAQRESERAEELYERTLISDHELQLARIELVSAGARYREAQASLTRARLDLEYSQVRAPFAALVLQRNVEPGQTVVTRLQSMPLVVLAEAERMRTRVVVPLRRIERLRPGQVLPVWVGDQEYAGEVRELGLEPSESAADEPLYEIAVDFPLPAGRVLRAGQRASVTLP